MIAPALMACAQEPPASTPPVQLPKVEVTASKIRKRETPNPLFDHTFADVRSGPLIEAILWRHKFLEDHPGEDAIIVTTHTGDRIRSATTLYTRDGNFYASSNVIGEKVRVAGLVAADLHRTEGIAQAQKFIAGVRSGYRDSTQAVNGVGASDANSTMETMFVSPDMAARLELELGGGSLMDLKPLSTFSAASGPANGSADPQSGGSAQSNASSDLMGYRAMNDAYVSAVNSLDPSVTFSLGSLMLEAEETGDYRVLGRAASPPSIVDVEALRRIGMPENQISQMICEKLQNNLSLRRSFVQSFSAPSDELLSQTYQALHDPVHAGIIPVTLAPLGGKGTAVALPGFAKSAHLSISQSTCLTLDWKGIQYYYQPDLGTWAKPLPTDAVTGEPYLCVKNGALMECVYFCSTYMKLHPGKKAVLVPGDPVAAAYEFDGKLGLLIPARGRFTLPKEYIDALGDLDALSQVRDQLLAIEKQRGTPISAIPEEMPGDDGDLQMRRAYLAFQDAGIPCQLAETGSPSLKFTWDDIDYVYGSDQHIHGGLLE